MGATSPKGCFDIPNGCLAYDVTNTKCTSAAPGYALETNGATVNIMSIITTNAACDSNKNFGCAIRAWTYSRDASAVLTETVSSCGKGTEVKNNRCVATTVSIPNCSNINQVTGNCDTCAAGFVVSTGSSTKPNRDNILLTQCVPAITGCKTYGNNGKCTDCSPAADGSPRYIDAIGNVCIAQKERIQGCNTYAVNDITKCW